MTRRAASGLVAVALLAACTGDGSTLAEPGEPTLVAEISLGDATELELGISGLGGEDGVFGVAAASGDGRLFVFGGLRRAEPWVLAPVATGLIYDGGTETVEPIPPWPGDLGPYGADVLWAGGELFVLATPCPPFDQSRNDDEVVCDQPLRAAAYDPGAGRWRSISAPSVDAEPGGRALWVRAEGVTDGVAVFSVLGSERRALVGFDLETERWRVYEDGRAADGRHACFSEPYVYGIRLGPDVEAPLERLDVHRGGWVAVDRPGSAKPLPLGATVRCQDHEVLVDGADLRPTWWLDGASARWVELPEPIGADHAFARGVRVRGAWVLFPNGGPRQVLLDPEGQWRAGPDQRNAEAAPEWIEATDELIFTFDRPVGSSGATGTIVTAIEVEAG